MKITTECLECLMRRNLAKARALGSEDTAMAFAREMLSAFLAAPDGVSAPYFSPITADLFHKYYGLAVDRYREEKAFSNRFVLERLDTIRAKIRGAEDPIFAALQFSILGNYIDFSALADEVDFDVLDSMLEKALEMELDRQVYAALLADCAAGKQLLYLTDNAGEIGFDRLLAEELHRQYPNLAITFCVRGGPALNDATREDAELVGIPFPIIDNGTRISGTELPFVRQELKDAIAAADVVIAKGQGNTETMLGCGYNVYYAFLVKCQRFIDTFQKPKLTPMLVRDSGGAA